MSLSETERDNLGKYIRSCEIEKQVSETRAEHLKTCIESREPSRPDWHTSIIIIFLSGALGYAIGAQR